MFPREHASNFVSREKGGKNYSWCEILARARDSRERRRRRRRRIVNDTDTDNGGIRWQSPVAFSTLTLKTYTFYFSTLCRPKNSARLLAAGGKSLGPQRTRELSLPWSSPQSLSASAKKHLKLCTDDEIQRVVARWTLADVDQFHFPPCTTICLGVCILKFSKTFENFSRNYVTTGLARKKFSKYITYSNNWFCK